MRKEITVYFWETLVIRLQYAFICFISSVVPSMLLPHPFSDFLFFFLPVLARSYCENPINFASYLENIGKITSLVFLELLSRYCMEMRYRKFCPLLFTQILQINGPWMGMGSVPTESVAKVGKTRWKIVGSLTEGGLPSSCVASSHGLSPVEIP